MQYLTVKNWRDHQHYKLRTPPWIKLHRAIIEDYAFAALKDKTKAHLVLIWVLAAGTEGRIPNDPKFIASKISANEPVDMEAMIAAGFLIAEGEPEQTHTEPAPTPKQKKEKIGKRPLPQDWAPTAETIQALSIEYSWRNGDADKYIAAFRDACASKGYQYADFDAAFRNCVRADWPKLRATGKVGEKRLAI